MSCRQARFFHRTKLGRRPCSHSYFRIDNRASGLVGDSLTQSAPIYELSHLPRLMCRPQYKFTACKLIVPACFCWGKSPGTFYFGGLTWFYIMLALFYSDFSQFSLFSLSSRWTKPEFSFGVFFCKGWSVLTAFLFWNIVS